MGVVYRAQQVNMKRLVALKLIRDSALAGKLERARFRIEAEAAARMHHPNIVQIYDVGEHLGRPYFAMELVEGGSLDQHLAGRPQPPALAAELIRTLALAVQHAHEQRIVHRDLKPANVMLSFGREPPTSATATVAGGMRLDEATPKITDFGLAKRLDTESTAWTQDGAILGTASYMAPEQAAGRSREISIAVDIYALGAILYEMLTGRPPFQAESWNETVARVLYDEPSPPTRWHADVPPDLETVCLKCLEKAPGRRYASAGELAHDLTRFLEGRPVTAVPLGKEERLARLAARDGYQLAGEIGRGPRSTVYRALYGPLKHPVAVKVFPPGTCTREEWDDRLRRDADLWAALAHPHIVPVQRAGWWDGIPYLAMEYVAHGSLAARLAGQPIPMLQALRLVDQLTETVRFFHRQGVVHGNLKPSNVLLAADGIPRVSDFRSTGGLFQGPPPPSDADLTGLGYLAAELVQNPGGETRFYTDIYGLGLILYELLTGRPAFAGATAKEVLEHVGSQDPVPPSRLNPDVTPYLEAVCLRCLRKDPWSRFRRVYDLFWCLQAIQDKLDGGDRMADRRPKRRPPGDSGAQRGT
jgi:serine/threonine protein kinase